MRIRPLLRLLWLPLAGYLLAAGMLWFSIGPQAKVVLRAEEKLSPVGFTPDGRLLVTRPAVEWLYDYGSISTGPIRIWDIASGQEQHRILEDAADIGALALSPDGRQLAVLRHDRVTIVDVASGQQVAAWPCLPAQWQSFLWSPDGKSLASLERVGGNQVRVRLFDARTLEMRLTQEELDVNSNIAFSPDGRWLATGDRGPSFKKMESQNIRLWDTATGQLVKTFRVEDEYLMGSFDFSPDSSLLMADCNKTVVWEVASGRMLWEGHRRRGDIRSPGLLPSGDGLASVDCAFRLSDGMEISLTVRDPRTGQVTSEIDLGTAHGGADLLLSPNRRWAGVQYIRHGIPVSMDDALRTTGLTRTWPWLNQHLHSSWRVFDLASGDELLTVRGRQLVFSSGSLVATATALWAGDGDGAVRIYDLPAPKPLGLILGWALAGPMAIVGLQLMGVIVGRVFGWLGRGKNQAIALKQPVTATR